MSLGLGDGYFDPNSFGHSQQNAGSVMDTRSNAVLYVFKPYDNQFKDVSIRSFQYNFDENFLSATQEITELSTRQLAPPGAMIEQLRSRQNLNGSIIPSFQPTMTLKSSYLSDKWRFILLLTQKSSDLIGGGTVAVGGNGNGSIRRIYNGYFEDEPFNALTASYQQKTLNPHAFMVITHKTVLGTSTSMGAYGANTFIRTRSSEEIINPANNLALTSFTVAKDNQLHLMTPANCLNAVEADSDGIIHSTPGAHSNISQDRGNSPVLDILEQPGHHVGQVVKGVIGFTADVTSRNRLSMNRHEHMFEDAFIDQSAHRMKLSKALQMPRASMNSELDLDINARISPVDLANIVNGALDVQPIDLHRPMFYETADQQELSVVNQMSYMIASVISPVLNAAGMNEITFTYEIRETNGLPDDNFIVQDAKPSWPVPEHDLVSMIHAIRAELQEGIFATIFASVSDFHVAVRANVTGMTVVRLNLVGQGIRNTVDFEIPSCLGGMVSPLLGDSRINAHNSQEIETLYGTITGIVGNTNTNGQFDAGQQAFMNYTQGDDWMNKPFNDGLKLD